MELEEAEFFTRDGQDMIRVYMTYTNNNADGLYLYESFSIKAFQNDVEIRVCTPTADEELLAEKVYTYEAQDTD